MTTQEFIDKYDKEQLIAPILLAHGDTMEKVWAGLLAEHDLPLISSIAAVVLNKDAMAWLAWKVLQNKIRHTNNENPPVHCIGACVLPVFENIKEYAMMNYTDVNISVEEGVALCQLQARLSCIIGHVGEADGCVYSTMAALSALAIICDKAGSNQRFRTFCIHAMNAYMELSSSIEPVDHWMLGFFKEMTNPFKQSVAV